MNYKGNLLNIYWRIQCFILKYPNLLLKHAAAFCKKCSSDACILKNQSLEEEKILLFILSLANYRFILF